LFISDIRVPQDHCIGKWTILAAVTNASAAAITKSMSASASAIAWMEMIRFQSGCICMSVASPPAPAVIRLDQIVRRPASPNIRAMT
jgi:hypothetical protein